MPAFASILYLVSALLLAAQALAVKDLEWGVYQIHWGAKPFERGIKAQAELLGANPQYVLFFQDLSAHRGFPASAIEVCHSLGATPIVSQELWEWRHRHSDDDSWLYRINRGDYDEHWRDWARAAKNFEHRIILRLGFEMNGDWFDWGQQPKAFISAWRRVHQIVRADIGATNVEFMFAPNVEWDAYKPLADIDLYYPGEKYVQLLGLDGYNFGDNHSEWHQWESFESVFGSSLEKLSKYPHPIFLSEVGCAEGPRKAEWIADFLNYVQNNEQIIGFIYYNHYDGKKGEPNWRLDSDPDSLEVFRNYLEAD